jgi:hypothetical protein
MLRSRSAASLASSSARGRSVHFGIQRSIGVFPDGSLDLRVKLRYLDLMVKSPSQECEERTPYRALCSAAERAAGTVKLGHGPEGWGVEVVLRPTSEDPAFRAAGAIFPDIGELNGQSSHLLRWLTSCRGAAATEEVR